MRSAAMVSMDAVPPNGRGGREFIPLVWEAASVPPAALPPPAPNRIPPKGGEDVRTLPQPQVVTAPPHMYNRTRRKRESSHLDRLSRCSNGSSEAEAENASADRQSNVTPAVATAHVATCDVRAPWMPPGRRYAKGVIGLHEDIEDFFQWIVPTPSEHELRLGVIERIRSTVLDLWPNARVEIFGSFRTGLYLPTSDIDLVICGKWAEMPLRTLERALLGRNIPKRDSLMVLDKAAVPIIKLTDQQSNIKVDISFNMSNGIRAAEFIKFFKKVYPVLPKLIYVLKQFLLQRDLNEVFSGGLSSYALLLLMVNFLQLHPRPDAGKSPTANLGVLLLEFLELYGRNFNFLHAGIRVREGGAVLPKEELKRSMPEGHQPSLICIEDPLDCSNDVGRSSYGAMTVIKAFEVAYAQLADRVLHGRDDGGSILCEILSVSSEVLEFRRRVAASFPSPSRRRIFVGELAQPPQYPAPISPDKVEPKELPPRPNSERQQNQQHSRQQRDHLEHQQPHHQETTSKAEDSDSLSTVSTGSIGRIGAINSNNSDNDSDVLICATSASASPSSAMSISPATSEVGGVLAKSSANSLRSLPGSKLESAFNKSAVASTAKLRHGGSSNNVGKPKSQYWKTASCNNGGSGGLKEGPDRADLDLNWRAQEKTDMKSADSDTNWRDHDEPQLEDKQLPWKTTKKNVIKKQGNKSSIMNGKGATINNIEPSPQSTTSTSPSTASAKERLTAGLLVTGVGGTKNDASVTVDNRVQDNNNVDDNRGVPAPAVHNEKASGYSSKKKTPNKKRKKRVALVSSATIPGSEQARFSYGPGLGEPNR